MRQIPKATSYVVMLKAFLASDHITAATGVTVAVTLSKAGGAFANPNVGATNATEVSSGWYKVTLDATDTGTAGDLVVRGTSATIDDTEQACQVDDGSAILDVAAGVETNLTVRQALRLVASTLFSETSGMDTGTKVFRDYNDTKNRLSVTVASTGRTTFGTRDAT